MSDAQVPAVERRARAAPGLKGVERAKLLDQFASLHEQHPGDVALHLAPPYEVSHVALDENLEHGRERIESCSDADENQAPQAFANPHAHARARGFIISDG